MNQTVFCFGELLLRMSPALGGEWIAQNSMPVYVGGAELNVATALGCWNVPARYGTALPDHYLTDEILAYVRSRNIDTSAVHRSGERIGTYYLPQGADLKNAGVIYDRAYSSYAELKPGMINWKEALAGCGWFHFSAISPALNEDAVNVLEEALEAASSSGLKISVDLNYRAKLWKYGKAPQEIMPRLVKYCNLVMGNIWAAGNLLGIPVDTGVHLQDDKNVFLTHASKTAAAIREQYPRCEWVANTFRFDAGNGIRYYASLDSAAGQSVSPVFETQLVVDKIGSGDCFMGGLIYGFWNELEPVQIIGYAAAAAFGKLQEKSDATRQTENDVKRLLNAQAANL